MIIVISGATSGIGEKTAEYLLTKGHTIYSLARTTKDNPNINYVKCDITDSNQIKEALKSIYEKEKRIDVLINNAGMGISGSLEFSTSEDIQRIIDVNFNGLVNASRLVLPYLRETKGYLINIGSVAGEVAIPFQTMYSATKAAVGSFSEGLANEVRPLEVKVTTILPGDTKTSFTANRKKNEDDDIYGERVLKSVSKMEKDEQGGGSPLKVAKTIEKCLRKKKLPPKITVGLDYKFLVFLKRILPRRTISYILYRMYGK